MVTLPILSYTYNFVKIFDVYKLLTPAMNEYGVNFDITKEEATRHDSNGDPMYYHTYIQRTRNGDRVVWVYEADLTILWTNADNPKDTLEVTLHAIGTNDGGPDKAKGSAWTYCLKYYLFEKFGIDQGEDDPDGADRNSEPPGRGTAPQNGARGKVIPAIVGLVGAFMLFKKLKSITGIFSGLFGGGSGGGGPGGGSGGILGGFGKMKIGTTLKGLANIGLVVVALGALAALLALVAPHITSLCSGEQFLKLMAAITATGLVGSAMAGLAGAVGNIPIPVVVAGLEGIAIALGGFTLIVEAFGLLTEIPGFNKFLKKGGEVLAELCRIIGEMVGSIIGGIGEGITKSLVKIGDNLSAFAVSIEPMITTFSGLNYEGLKEFAEAFGIFALVMAGDALLKWITGGTD